MIFARKKLTIKAATYQMKQIGDVQILLYLVNLAFTNMYVFVVYRGVRPPQSHDATFPLTSPSPSLPFSLPFLPPFVSSNYFSTC